MDFSIFVHSSFKSVNVIVTVKLVMSFVGVCVWSCVYWFVILVYWFVFVIKRGWVEIVEKKVVSKRKLKKQTLQDKQIKPSAIILEKLKRVFVYI